MGLAVRKRPYKRSSDPDVAQLQDVASAAASVTTPGFITGVPSLAELRKTRGDVNGEAGPPTITVGGTQEPGDGGGDTYVWRPGDNRDDNNGDNTAGEGIVQVVGVDRGRWVRPSTADKTAALDLFTATAAGLAPASGGGTSNYLRADGSWATPPLTPSPPGKSLIRRSVLTSGTSLAKATGVTLARAYLLGGGGGGAGIASTGAGQNGAGGGGAAGAAAYFETTAIPAGSWTYAIGAAGTGGANTGANGNAGGNTTFSDGTTTVTAPGGGGGTQLAPSASANIGGGGTTSTATNGTINGSGAPGGPAVCLASGASPVQRGAGGNSAWGGAGKGGGAVSGSSAGASATGYGSGGAGAAVAASSGTGAAGGDGFQGLIILEEWG